MNKKDINIYPSISLSISLCIPTFIYFAHLITQPFSTFNAFFFLQRAVCCNHSNMWALSRRRITHAGVLSLLSEFKEKHCYDSSTWLLLSHLRRLDMNLVSETGPRATVSSELLRSASNTSAYPFTILPESIKKSILFCAPPPAANKAMIVSKRNDGSFVLE